jgi:pyridoxine 4-dehydrogenase
MSDSDISAALAGTITLGDLQVSRLGIGTNRITDTPQGQALLRRAVELGVNFIDTAYVYQNGASETAIGNTLAPYAPGLIIATKGGLGPDGPEGRPEQLRDNLEHSLRRLRTDCIEIYQLHRLDPHVPIGESVAALKQFQDEGKIKHIGLSEVNVDELETAIRIAPIVSVQNEYNVANRKHEDLLTYCTDHEIAFIPWFPLGGLRGDTAKVEKMVAAMAEKYQSSSQQIALAWLLKRSKVMLPIPGTTSIEHLEANLRAAAIQLSDEDYDQLREARPES